MKKNLMSIVCVCICCLAFAQHKGTVIIKGTINGDLKGYDKMYMYTRLSNDSSMIEDGRYTFSFPFQGTDMKMFLPEYVMKGNMTYRPFGILVDGPGTYYITTDVAKGMYNSEVKGSEGAVLFRQFGKDQDEAYKNINNGLAALYGKDWYRIDEKDPRYEAYKQSTDSLQSLYMIPLVEKLVKQHPNSPASAYVLAGFVRGIGSVEKQEQLYDLLSPAMKRSPEGTKFYHYIEGVKNSAIGKEVSNFTLPDPEDKPVNFDQFKGRYVLIDFWASWCVPCRQSFPKMRRIYQQYKDKGFDIYSISIDESKSNWLKAVKEENNPWAQSLDTKDIASKGFAVTAVPTAYLISPDGKIIAKQVGFDANEEGDIEKRLDALFGPVPAAPEQAQPASNKGKKVMKAIPMTKMQ